MSDLVLFHKQLGDTVLLEPVLRKLAAASGEQVHLLCPRQMEPLVSLMPHTRMAAGRGRWLPDRVWAYDWSGRSTRAAALTLCREKHLLIPNPSWVTRKHRWFFSRVHAEPYLGRYLARYFWDHTEVDAGGLPFSMPQLALPPAEWQPADADLAQPGYVLLNPVSAWKRKCYDAPKWAAVLKGAHDLGCYRVVMTGGKESWQMEHCASIVEHASRLGLTVTDASGRTSLQGYMHLISRASMVFCIDGAAAHLARAFGVPCLTLFGPTLRWQWHAEDKTNIALDATPYSTDPRPPTSLIPVEKVLEALQRILSARE
ncbi:MAG: glycosyltransferase family 9 protein [Verrucomicrobiota bacterium]|nr:glycosyltransferase family 9 protein [Verrucomicrobiota bacterium]